ncbi:CpXC domain-containing protein [Actinoplanes sp. NPDC051475]|uniref:CpXC domain-containing protein n=1 Tax=Actinoplanes sp. NPDC051475 TaxID=3157225 RepID=UPI00344E439F
MPSLTDSVRVTCERCSHVQDHEMVYVLDASERPDLVRRCLAGRIRTVVCEACREPASYDLPLLVYRPDDGGLSALLSVAASDDDHSRLIGWLYSQLGRAFDDEPAGVLPTDEQGLIAILCRSVATDLAAPYLDDFPDVAKYRDLLEALRLSGSHGVAHHAGGDEHRGEQKA